MDFQAQCVMVGRYVFVIVVGVHLYVCLFICIYVTPQKIECHFSSRLTFPTHAVDFLLNL